MTPQQTAYYESQHYAIEHDRAGRGTISVNGMFYNTYLDALQAISPLNQLALESSIGWKATQVKNILDYVGPSNTRCCTCGAPNQIKHRPCYYCKVSV